MKTTKKSEIKCMSIEIQRISKKSDDFSFYGNFGTYYTVWR